MNNEQILWFTSDDGMTAIDAAEIVHFVRQRNQVRLLYKGASTQQELNFHGPNGEGIAKELEAAFFKARGIKIK